MKKLLIVALVLVVAVSLSLVVPAVAVSANPGPPTIDGVVGTDEWAGATVIDVESLNDLEIRLGISPLTSLDVVMGTVSVLAYADYLYVLFEVTDSTDARIPGENLHGNDQTSININPTAAPWGKPCDIIFQIGADPDAWGGTSSGTTDGWETDWEIDGVQQPTLPGDLETMTLYDYVTGTRISEWKIPLASIAPSQEDTLKVGGAIDVGDGKSYLYPVGLDWGDVLTYVEVTVQPTSVGVTANVPVVVRVSVDPTFWDFDTVYPGQDSDEILVTVKNTGTVPIRVTTELRPTGTVFDTCLYLPSGTLIKYFGQNLVGGAYWANNAQLQVPRDYTATGEETATIIFWATPY